MPLHDPLSPHVPHRPLRVYIAGPMTGLAALNRPAFIAAALQLRGLGLDAVNPVELNLHTPADSQPLSLEMHWRACMRVDIAAMLRCDAVALLPGWEHSRGAKLERLIADGLGLRVHPISTWLHDGTLVQPENADPSFAPPTTTA